MWVKINGEPLRDSDITEVKVEGTDNGYEVVEVVGQRLRVIRSRSYVDVRLALRERDGLLKMLNRPEGDLPSFDFN